MYILIIWFVISSTIILNCLFLRCSQATGWHPMVGICLSPSGMRLNLVMRCTPILILSSVVLEVMNSYGWSPHHWDQMRSSHTLSCWLSPVSLWISSLPPGLLKFHDICFVFRTIQDTVSVQNQTLFTCHPITELYCNQPSWQSQKKFECRSSVFPLLLYNKC